MALSQGTMIRGRNMETRLPSNQYQFHEIYNIDKRITTNLIVSYLPSVFLASTVILEIHNLSFSKTFLLYQFGRLA
jgi:hypothetical protein